uniref:Uncharacterized protein n=1 Tax=Arundo donax TaxID=35708 RepID=A0A0A9AND3_ARUDO
MLSSVNGRGCSENSSNSCQPIHCKIAVVKTLQNCLSI